MKKVSIPLQRRASLLLRKTLPVIAWLGIATWIAMSWADKSSYADLRGIAQSQNWEVSGTEPGRLTEIRANLLNPVMAGEVLAVLDDTPLLAEIVIARKSVEQTQAEVDALRHTLKVAAEEVASDWNADLRRFHVDVEKARLKSLSLSLNRAELLASIGRQTALAKSHKSHGAILENQVATAELEFRRQETLVIQRAGSDAQAESAKIKWLAARSELALNNTQTEDALQRITEAELALISMAEQEKENGLQETESLARLAAFQSVQPNALPFADDSRLSALHANVEVQRARVDALLLRRESLMIRAGAAAVVQSIGARPGQAVLAGESILTLAAKHTQQVLAWAPPGISKRLKAGDDFLVSSAGTQPLKATLLRLGPTVEEMPLAMRRNPTVAEYGHPLLLGLPENAEFIPGEPVRVQALLVR